MVRDVLVGLLMVVILKIFLPWWIIILIMGPVIVLAGYGWITRVTGLDPLWAKRIITIVSVIFLISLGGNLINQKWPWLGKAIESRSLYSSFWVTDQTDPKYPETLAMSLYQTEKMELESEEKMYQGILEGFQKKLADGKKLDDFDRLQIKEAKKKLIELDKKLADIRLSRSNGIAKLESVRTKTLLSRILWFGIILLVVGLTLKLTTKKKYGGLWIWAGALALSIFLVLTLFGPEIQANAPEIKKWIQSSAVRKQDTRPVSGIYKLPADGRVVSRTTDGRELWDQKGGRVRFSQLSTPGRFVIVNQNSPSWDTSERVITSGIIRKEGQIRLMSADKRDLTVQVEIIK